MTVWMNSRRTIGIESRCRFVEDEQVGLGADGGDERELRPLALRQMARLLADIEPELREQRALGVAGSSALRNEAK